MESQNRQPSTDNHQPKLKVCGLTKLNQIQELTDLGVDFLGFIFYEKSPRYVLNHLTFKQIENIKHHGKVGVFVNEDLEKVIDIIEKTDIQYVQLHGDEDEDFISELKYRLMDTIKIIKVIRVGCQMSDVRCQIDKISNFKSQISNLLFDTDSKAFGGTGKTFDWNILNEIEIHFPYFLSGGISEESIKKLKTINQKPFALDINSKFEIEAGNKDLEKIKKFMKFII
ncbi:MAG: phosphoribosylanthranilate isomerase [Bergeyella sp.]